MAVVAHYSKAWISALLQTTVVVTL